MQKWLTGSEESYSARTQEILEQIAGSRQVPAGHKNRFLKDLFARRHMQNREGTGPRSDDFSLSENKLGGKLQQNILSPRISIWVHCNRTLQGAHQNLPVSSSRLWDVSMFLGEEVGLREA